MLTIQEISEKAKKSLENSVPLSKSLDRREFLLFRRANPLLKVDPKYVPYIEVECWSSYGQSLICSLLQSADCKVYNIERESDDRYRRGYSSNPAYPYKSWYVHRDGTIVIDQEKAKKLALLGNFPIKIIAKNAQMSDEDMRLIELTDEELSQIAPSISEKIEIAKESVKKLKETLASISGFFIDSDEYKVAIGLAALELSSPALFNFRELRKAFYLFKTKGINNQPCLFVNPSCGLHVSFRLPPTLNMQNRTTYINRLITIYVLLEKQIMDIVPDHRKSNGYCKLLNNCATMEAAIQTSIIDKYSALYANKGNGSFQEFRFLGATSNVNDIQHWILFLQCLCQYAGNFTAPINADIHLFDVVTHPLLQDWYLNRRIELTTEAIIDKVDPLTTVFEIYSTTKKKRDDNEKEQKRVNSKKTGTVNSKTNKRKPVLSTTRFANAQAARRRLRSGRH